MTREDVLIVLICVLLLGGCAGVCLRRASAGGLTPLFDNYRDRRFVERLDSPRVQPELDAYIDARIAEQAPRAVYRHAASYWREGGLGAALIALLRMVWARRKDLSEGSDEG